MEGRGGIGKKGTRERKFVNEETKQLAGYKVSSWFPFSPLTHMYVCMRASCMAPN